LKYGLIYSDKFELLNYGADHPFKKERFIKVKQYFQEKIPEIPILNPREYSIELLQKIHTKKYINLVKELSKKGKGYLSIDTPVFPKIFEWALTYTWASLTAAELVKERHYNILFNPCGGLHHAKRNTDGGFCVFNDVALAATYLHDSGIEVVIVDIDAHAGDGTMQILYEKPILKINTHEDPTYLYPGTGFINQVGEGKGYGYTLNIPVPPGSTDDALIRIFDEIIVPALKEIKPEIIILQAGVDGYRRDPLTHLRYTTHGYHAISKKLKEITNRIIMLGGGGYSEEVHILWATIFTTLIDRFEIIKQDALKIDPQPTECDEYLCKRIETIIQTILATHPLFKK